MGDHETRSVEGWLLTPRTDAEIGHPRPRTNAPISLKWAVSKVSESLADFPANIQSWRRSPPIPKGASGPISGPVTNPSTETLNSNRTVLIALFSFLDLSDVGLVNRGTLIALVTRFADVEFERETMAAFNRDRDPGPATDRSS
jgi:hypothetical protein